MLYLNKKGGDQWKKKLIQPPQTYDGSFADADMQKFRPAPNPNPMEDPWYASRLPDPSMAAVDRLAMPFNFGAQPYGPEAGPYNTWYPQDELSAIKMRNRRYQNAVMGEMMSLNGNMGGYYPQQGMMMRGMPMNMPIGPAPPPPAMFDYEQAQDELSVRENNNLPFAIIIKWHFIHKLDIQMKNECLEFE